MALFVAPLLKLETSRNIHILQRLNEVLVKQTANFVLYPIVEANKAFLNLYPEDVRDSVIGTTTLERYDPEEAEGFLTEDRKAFEEGGSEVFETINFPDGTVRTLLTKKTRFENSEGAPFILGVARDITPLRKTEEALRNANEELEEFAYRTSHDLRSPLVSSTRLLNIVQKQIEKNDLAKAGEHIGMVISSLSNLENLVTDILQLTKIKYTQESETEINIEELVEASLKKLNHMEGFSAISIKKQFKHTGALFTYHDQILQVVENLISNAIKYYDPKEIEPSINISTSSDDKHFFISVSDNGLGIPTKSRDKVFTMFKRFHPRTSFGSGLGLYMIKKCVEKMHGDISYLPLAKGTEFSIKIPLQEFTKA